MSDQPSPSESGHPSREMVELPHSLRQESGIEAGLGLSPYPSSSLSDHWDGSSSNASPSSDQPSPSLSRQPRRSWVLVPLTLGQSSDRYAGDGLSPKPSESESAHWLSLAGKASAPSSVPPSPEGSEYPSSSASGQPILSNSE